VNDLSCTPPGVAGRPKKIRGKVEGGIANIKKYIGWLLIAYSTFAILYGQFGRARLRFTHTPFYYVSFILLVIGIALVLKKVTRR
jgi:hypothetical protein